MRPMILLVSACRFHSSGFLPVWATACQSQGIRLPASGNAKVLAGGIITQGGRLPAGDIQNGTGGSASLSARGVIAPFCPSTHACSEHLSANWQPDRYPHSIH